eukprot:maker-scaffold382_size189932-snap-gene-0.23 protein:Tk03700 transcript:maker-scaffold382_size189932-snap-gene-0.23-mRNA-1 annotation:"drongo protein isoform 2"
MRRAKGAETDKSSQQLRAIQSLDIHNKCCLDCGQRGPTYVNMTIGAFVCTKCSGMLRGVTPPHRIKSISMSSFSSEEIDFLRPRGNLWCQKVWLGSHDADLRTLDSMDDEAIKEFIIEKYEKKRYYVDPSTISHLLPQPGPVVPVGVQPEEGTRSNLIGTTLAARLGPGHLRSSTNGFSSVVSRPTNNSTVTQPPNMEAFAAVAKTSTASSNNNKSAGSNLLAAFASPGTDNGSDPFGMSNSTPTTATPSKTKSKSETNDFFADFDAANFETPTTAPIPTPQGPTPFGGGGSSWNNTPPFKPSPANPSAKKHQVTRPQSTPITNQSSAADKYAALKDLDDIFRCSVTINDSANNSGSTGVSIFGSSPAPGSKTKSLFEGGGPSLASSVPRASGSIFDTNSSPWSGFNQETTSTTNPTGATWDWGDRNGTANKARASSASGTTSPPPVINPFAAATNMSQLNTSPWPTTGTSPVNHPPTSTSGGDSSNWPQASGGSGANGPPPAGFDSDPFATFNLQSGTKPNLGFNSTFKTTDDPFASTDDTNGFSNTQAQGNGNGNFDAFFSSISQSTNQLGVKAEANPWSNPQNDLFTINNPGVGASASGRKSTNPFL